MANYKEEIEINKQILEDLKSRQEIIREEINTIKLNIKVELKEHNETQKNSTRHGLLSIGKDTKNDMRPYAQKVGFYSENQKLYDLDEEKAKMDSETYLTVIQNVLSMQKVYEKEASTSLDNLRGTVRSEWVQAMNEWANENVYH